MIECTELIAVDLFNPQARRIQLGDVEQYLARLRNIPVLIPVRPSRQPATGPPDSYPDPTLTGRRRRAFDQVMT